MNFEQERLRYLAKIIYNLKNTKEENFKVIDLFKYFEVDHYDVDFIDMVEEKLLKYYNSNDVVYKIIIEYVEKCEIGKIFPIDKKNLYKYKVYIDSFLIDKESIDFILEYMKKNGYPFINYIYCYLMREYLYNSLPIEDNKIKTNHKLIKGNFKK